MWTLFFKIFGLVLELTGAILIASAVFSVSQNKVTTLSLTELEESIQSDVKNETNLTIAGVFFLGIGFIFQTVAELV